MEEFRILLEIEHKGNKYKVLSNKNHQIYFIKVLENSVLMYPTLQEFKELYYIFGNNKIETKFYEIEDNEVIKSKPEKRKIIIEAKVFLRDSLISLALALSLIGVAYKEVSARTIEWPLNQEGNYIYTSTLKENYQANSTDETIEIDGIKLERIKGDMWVIKSHYDEKLIFCHSVDEFLNYLEVKNPTYDDVREVLESNSNIPTYYKEIIKKGIDNLQAQLPDINLSILYFNLSRAKIVEIPEEEVTKYAKYAVAYFNPEDSSINLSPNGINEETILHEALGHGATTGYVKSNKEIVFLSQQMMIFFGDKEGEDCVKTFGKSLDEAKAELITQIALGEEISNAALSYAPISEQLKIYMKMTKMDLTHFVNNGVIDLIKKMYENDIDEPLNYIENNDIFCVAGQNGFPITHPKTSIKHNLRNLFMDYCDDKLERGENLEEIISSVREFLSDSYYEIAIYNGDGTLGEDIVFPDLGEEVIDDIIYKQGEDR